MSKAPFKANPVLIPVPSGRLVFANDMRRLTGHVIGFDVNTPQGVYAMTRQYAFYGMGHVFVGNSSPSVIKDEDGLRVVTNTNKEGLGTIDTSLWWYSAMDADLFDKRCAAFGIAPDLAAFDAFVVDVKPGVHAVTWEDADRDVKDAVLSRISWVDHAPESLRQMEPDFSHAPSFVESRVWNAMITSAFSIDDMAEDMFTVLGNGFNWHHGQMSNLNGHPEDAPYAKRLPAAKDITDLLETIPPLPDFSVGFRGMGHCYPLSQNYPKLGAAPLNADPHDLALGMMVAKSLIGADFKVIGPKEQDTQIQNNREILTRELMVADEIATTRGLWKDGTMERIFREIRGAWLSTKATPDEPGL